MRLQLLLCDSATHHPEDNTVSALRAGKHSIPLLGDEAPRAARCCLVCWLHADKSEQRVVDFTVRLLDQRGTVFVDSYAGPVDATSQIDFTNQAFDVKALDLTLALTHGERYEFVAECCGETQRWLFEAFDPQQGSGSLFTP